MEDWKLRGITVHFANLSVDLSTPTGMLVANIMASVAQGESDLKSERNLEIAAFRRRANRPTNGERKFGYRRAGPKGDRQFTPFREEREVMARIIQLHDGGFTWREVSIIVDGWSEKITFKAVRLFSAYTLVDHFPKGYWAWWRCRLAYHVYKKILEREGVSAAQIEAIGDQPARGQGTHRPGARGEGDRVKQNGARVRFVALDRRGPAVGEKVRGFQHSEAHRQVYRLGPRRATRISVVCWDS